MRDIFQAFDEYKDLDIEAIRKLLDENKEQK